MDDFIERYGGRRKEQALEVNKDRCSRIPFKENYDLCLELLGSRCENAIYIQLKGAPEFRACKKGLTS